MNNRAGLLRLVGNTPLIRLNLNGDWKGAQVWCKLEFMNPGGSLKDRMCLGIVEDMESRNLLRPGDTLVEASAGNTAISLAMVCAAKRYALTLAMPDSVPEERKKLLASYGARMVMTPSAAGMKGALARATEILWSTDRAFMINQFDNPLNPEIHRRTTAIEILKGLGRIPDAFVAGVGTGGTLTGVGELLKGEKPDVRIVAVEPADSPILSGGDPGPHKIPGIGAGFIPRVLNSDIIDHVVAVEYEEALKTAGMLANNYGIHAGLSSGAAVHAAMRQAEGMGEDQSVVTILCDSGERYMCFRGGS